MFDPVDDLVCHGPVDLHAACLAAAGILRDRLGLDELRLGLFMRVGSGMHDRTRQLPATVALFTALPRH